MVMKVEEEEGTGHVVVRKRSVDEAHASSPHSPDTPDNEDPNDGSSAREDPEWTRAGEAWRESFVDAGCVDKIVFVVFLILGG